MESSSPPPLNYLVRGPEGLSLLSGPPFEEGNPKVRLERIPCNSAKYSDDGSKLLLTTPTGVDVYDCEAASKIRAFEILSMSAAVLSPQGTFLQTFRRPLGPEDRNVVLWDVSSRTELYQLSQKQLNKANWPMFQFSEDETVVCRMATNEMQFFDKDNFGKGIVSRIRLPGIAAMQLSTSPPKYIAAYVPEAKGKPASVQIFEREAVGHAQPVARRSFFKCSRIQLIWNRGSTGLLVLAQSDVDKSNQSYYGETRLHYLTTDGCHEGHVPLSKEGPVHDVQWSPSGLEFAVVYGFMPSRTTLFDKKCKPLFDFGTGPYNTLRWNPKGKILCVAGFGNLPGNMAFWDCSSKKLLGETKAEWSVISEWSPDGLYFMAATTAPRLQVDNGIKIFSYNGTLYSTQVFEKLYQAEWRPANPSAHADLPELVEQMKQSLQIGTRNAALNVIAKSQTNNKPSVPQQPSTKNSATTTSKPAAYQPPHAKNASSINAQLFGEANSSQEMSKAALKNKKKRERQREKKAQEEGALNTT